MKNKFTILGCGSSLGSPWITNYSGSLKMNSKNQRTRCCAHIQKGDLSVLIDTSPDIKYQFLKNKIKNLDSIIYTHEHADQTSGIFEMRPFYWKNKSRIPIYGSKSTIKALKNSYKYCFEEMHGYKPIMKAHIIGKKFLIKKNNSKISIKAFKVNHGSIDATGYVMEKIGYISDCNNVPKKNLVYLKNLNYLIVDCLKINKHPSHFNLVSALNLINLTKPKKAILTNLHTDLDYYQLKKNLPKNILPAYDGLSFYF